MMKKFITPISVFLRILENYHRMLATMRSHWMTSYQLRKVGRRCSDISRICPRTLGWWMTLSTVTSSTSKAMASLKEWCRSFQKPRDGLLLMPKTKTERGQLKNRDLEMSKKLTFSAPNGCRLLTKNQGLILWGRQVSSTVSVRKLIGPS
jgi:hypothetical protein